MSSIADFRTPIPSPFHKPPFFGNPTSDSYFSLCFDLNSAVSDTATMSSSSTAEIASREFSGATEGVFYSPASQGNFNLSGMSGRPRPRLLKTRKQVGSSQQGRLGSAFNKVDPGFNPFRPASDSASNSSVSNEYRNSDSEVKSVKFENVGFVFGASRSDHSSVKLGSQKAGENKTNWDSSDIGIGSKTSDTGMNVNSGEREFSESVSNFLPDNRPKINVCGEFGETIGIGDRAKAKIQSNEEFQNFDIFGSIYGADKDSSASTFEFEKQESSQNVGNSVFYDNVAFKSGCSQRSSVGNLYMEEKKTFSNMEKMVSDDGTQAKKEINVQNSELDSMRFVFGVTPSNTELNSKLEEEKSYKSFGKSISDDFSVDLKLGPDHRDSLSNLNWKKGECCKQAGFPVSNDKEELKVHNESDFQEAKEAAFSDNLFETGSSNLDKNNEKSGFSSDNSRNKSPSFTCNKELKNMKKFSNGVFYAKNNTSALGSDPNDKHTSEFSFNIDGGSKATACGISSLFGLSDDIKKLSINTPFSVDGSDENKFLNLDSFSKSDNIFVFGSKGASSSRSSSTSRGQVKNSNIRVFRNAPSVEGISEQKIKMSNNMGPNDTRNESGNNNSQTNLGCSFEISGKEGQPGNLKDNISNDTRNESGNNNSQTNLGCSFEISGKEGQPGNLKDNISNSPPVGCIPSVFTSQTGLANSFDAAHCPQVQINDDNKSKEADRPSSLFSVCPDALPDSSVFEASLTSGFEWSFSTTAEVLEEPVMNVKTPKEEAPISFTAKFCSGLNEKIESNAKRKIMKDKRLKKDRGKLKQPSIVKLCPGKDSNPGERSSQEGLNSAGCYSPMDFSPYQETFPVTKEPLNLDNNCASLAEHSIFSADERDEDLHAGRRGVSINCGAQKGKQPNLESHNCNCDTDSSCHKSRTEPVCFSSCASVGSNLKTKESICVRQFFSGSSSEDISGRHFTFSASSPVQSHPSAVKHQYRKKNRLKGSSKVINSSSGVTLTSSSLQFAALNGNSLPFGGLEGQGGDLPSKGETKSEEDTGQVKQGSLSSASATMEVCEKWRLRGNQAYKNGKFSKAEAYYTKGINVVPSSDASTPLSSPLLEALVLCYSNRAATQMSLGKIREALGDCKKAVALDRNFLKARIRSANCHLMLGELDEALGCFNECVETRTDVCLDRRIVMEAFDGIEKVKKVDEYAKQSAELLQKSTSGAAATALDIIVKALSFSSYSERLLEMKAEALCLLRKYEEVIHLCNQSSNFAEKNFASLGIDTSSPNIEFSECNSSTYSNLWRLHMISKSYFRMGKLEVALDILGKQEHDRMLDSSTQLVVTVRELLRHKKQGNEAFQERRYAAAVEHYTAALSMNIESRPFAAICFCNRAAAHQALGQFADAIADCSLAIALDETYQKAISRRATLHERIRDYGQAASDLERLVSVLEKQSSESPSGSSSCNIEIRKARSRLSVVGEESKKAISLDLYLILGIKASDTESEIKKAYRKAALKHHPDKAAQFLTRSSGGDHGLLWKEVLEEVHRDADRLFKMIGEAYAVLSNPTKRSQYDYEEKIRSIPSSTQSSSDYYSYPYERNTSKGYYRRTYKTYGNSSFRW